MHLNFLSKGYRKPILLLFFLSPLIGEGLSGSTPPLNFLNPGVLFLLGSIYGSGALLVRDYARRWNKGWRSILILGAAYGIIEEGIMTRSFFNPNWPVLGSLSTYGRWLGVNWVWSEWLTIFHAIFSITIPIFLVELTYPRTKTQVWLSTRSRRLFHGLLIFAVILGFFAWPYDAPALAIAGSVVSVVLLGWVAKRIPNITPSSRNLKVSWKVLLPVGVSAPAAFLFLFTSAAIPVALGTIFVGAVLVLGYERLLTHWAKIGFNNMQKLGLITGALGFWAAFFDSILELIGRLGTSVLGISFIIYLVYLRKRTAQGLFPLQSQRDPHAGLPQTTEPVPRSP